MMIIKKNQKIRKINKKYWLAFGKSGLMLTQRTALLK